VQRADTVVIGAGVVGLAVARALAHAGRDVLVLEAESQCGLGASTRNSGVIHAGIYYQPNSLKARLCSRGRELLYALCARYGVAHRRCGKLIVATSASQLQALALLEQQGRTNDVKLQALDGAAARAREPHLTCLAALASPDTGIVDAAALVQCLEGLALAAGATLAYRSCVTHLEIEAAGITVGVNDEAPQLIARRVINCAGTRAPQLARATRGLEASGVPRGYLAKGHYFSLNGLSPFSQLIYPLPDAASLGIHLTLDLAGRARFGPDVEWVDVPDYRVDPARAPAFYSAIRRYWPALPQNALQADSAGIRAKIAGPGEPAADFRIDSCGERGAQLVNLFGIESPGLTASLAIAEEVLARVQEMI